MVKLLKFIQQLKDAYYTEYEIQNHNIIVRKKEEGVDFTLINQVLPVQYHVEFKDYYSSIYEESVFEFNEILGVKKVLFLLVALALEDGIKDY